MLSQSRPDDRAIRHPYCAVRRRSLWMTVGQCHNNGDSVLIPNSVFSFVNNQ
ncbi:MAG: hypothetical protein RI580_11865 [Halothece sp. Uz-M2-17]|nr:hypothetical protein [Halothece sp. Uz-M2-17]